MRRRSVALKLIELASRRLFRWRPLPGRPIESGWVRNMYYTALAMSNKFALAGCREGPGRFNPARGFINRRAMDYARGVTDAAAHKRRRSNNDGPGLMNEPTDKAAGEKFAELVRLTDRKST